MGSSEVLLSLIQPLNECTGPQGWVSSLEDHFPGIHPLLAVIFGIHPEVCMNYFARTVFFCQRGSSRVWLLMFFSKSINDK